MSALIRECRSCGHDHLVPVLSLGRMPLANAFLAPEQIGQPEETYPLDLVFCPACTLVQLTEVLPPEKLFREYLYLSSFSDTALRNAALLTERMTTSCRLGPGSLVVEIASNDGYLLQYYRDRGIPVLGVEPALNVARVAEARGVRTLREFFGEPLARQLSADGKQADVIHAHNVLAHVADLNGVVAGLRTLLKPDGVAVVEVPYLKDLIDHVEFDTIYHEHLCYFSLTALHHLFRRHKVALADIERISVHGGSLRVFVEHEDDRASANGRSSPSVRRLLEEEAVWGVRRTAFYHEFVAKVKALRDELLTLLRQLRARGHRLAAYGASAKGTTLLNYLGVGCETLDFVVDRSTVKQGRYTPGTHLPIFAPDMLLEAQPDYVLLLAWNWADEILAQQAEYRRGGGRFIIPIPKIQVV
jgi:SAM-dependent methyltransferase